MDLGKARIPCLRTQRQHLLYRTGLVAFDEKNGVGIVAFFLKVFLERACNGIGMIRVVLKQDGVCVDNGENAVIEGPL